MSCTNCANNCPKIISDKCIEYTGNDSDVLDISSGDSLFQVESKLIEALEQVRVGTGITLDDLNLTCEAIEDEMVGKDYTLENIIQAILVAFCALNTTVTTIDGEVNAPFAINTECLTLSDNPDRDEVLQALATKLCSVSSSVDTIAANYVKATQLCSLVTACIASTSSGGGGVTQEYTKMPKYVAMPYHGPLSVFDAQGKGLSSFGYDKVYLCNGQTVGTFIVPDYRGRTPVGANVNIPGGSLDASVDPSLPGNAGYTFSAGTKKGAYTDTITMSTMAAHSHVVTDPGHKHSEIGPGQIGDHAGGSSGYDRPNGTQVNQTGTSTTGVSIASAGGGQPHNNTQPSIGANFIMYVPS